MSRSVIYSRWIVSYLMDVGTAALDAGLFLNEHMPIETSDMTAGEFERSRIVLDALIPR
jgi:hypothetical protein